MQEYFDKQSLALSCKCNSVRGVLKGLSPKINTRYICHCDDCQAYARKLGTENLTLNVNGGTEILPAYKADIEISHGKQYLKYVKLTEAGPQRWYANCCKVPVPNCRPDDKDPFAGIIHTFIASKEDVKTQVVGPVKFHVMCKFAQGTLPEGSHQGMPLWIVLRHIVPFIIKGKLRKKGGPFP